MNATDWSKGYRLGGQITDEVWRRSLFGWLGEGARAECRICHMKLIVHGGVRSPRYEANALLLRHLLEQHP